MPALSVFIDAHSISLLVFISPVEYYLYNYPYVYSDAYFGSSYDATSFYKAVFENFLSKHKLKLSDVDLLLAGYQSAPSLLLETKLSKSLREVLKTIHSYYPIVINNISISTSDFSLMRTSDPLEKVHSEVKDSAEVDYYANMRIYPQLVSNDIPIQLDIDRNISSLLVSSKSLKVKFPTKTPIVFCGSRFTQQTVARELDYLLMLDVINNSGVFDIRVNRNNSLILFSLLKLFKPEITDFPDIVREGALISSRSAVECMVRTDVGTTQLVQLEKGRIMVLPLAHDERVNIMVKARDIENSERIVNGGKLGLIFDTRDSKNEQMSDVRVFNSGMKTFNTILGN